MKHNKLKRLVILVFLLPFIAFAQTGEIKPITAKNVTLSPNNASIWFNQPDTVPGLSMGSYGYINLATKRYVKNNKVNSINFTGTTTKTLTLNQVYGGTKTATFTDLDEQTLSVSSSGNTRTVTISNGNSIEFDVGNEITTGDLVSDTPALTVTNGDGKLVGGTTTLTLSLSAGDIAGCETKDSIAYNYGALYNWWAATDARKISSSDEWIIPTNEIFYTLISYCGGEIIAGGKLKKRGNINWLDQIPEPTNDFNFNAVGGGFRETFMYTAEFVNLRTSGYIWSSTPQPEEFPNCGYGLWMAYNTYEASYSYGISAYNLGFSIRLVREATLEELLLEDGLLSTTYIGNDLKQYSCIKIGTQVWLAANLNETKYRNGDWIHGFDGGVYTPISDENWVALETDGMCYYDDNEANGYQVMQVETTLCDELTSIKDSINTKPILSSGTAAPTSTPAKVGDIYVDISNKKIYVATGTSSSSDWTILN